MNHRITISPLHLGLIALLSILPYLNIFHNSFVWDDDVIIVHNTLIRDPKHLPTLLITTYEEGSTLRQDRDSNSDSRTYRPLVMVTYALNYAIGGLTPFSYQLVNLFAHTIVGLLLFLVICRLFGSEQVAVVAVAIFAVHPVHVEAVTGIVGRAELLAALFFVLGWLWYLDGRRSAWFASLGAYAWALLSKEHAATLPAILLLSDVYRLRVRLGRGFMAGLRHEVPRLLPKYAAYMLVFIGYLLVRVAVVGDVGVMDRPIPFLDNPLAHVDVISRVLTAVVVAAHYLFLIVWPAQLSIDYSYNQIPIVESVMDPRFLSASLVWAALLGLAWWSFARGAGRAFFAVAFMLLTSLPTANLLFPIGTIMGERLYYLPSVGACLLAGVAWQQVMRSQAAWGRIGPLVRPIGVGLLVTVLLCLGYRTVDRNRDWKHNSTLILAAAEVVPNSAKIRQLLGQEYYQAGNLEHAVREYKASLTILDHSAAHQDLGTAYLKQGRTEAAINEYRAALDLNPDNASAHTALGYAYLKTKEFEAALKALDTAIGLDPDLAKAHYNRGLVLLKTHKWKEAVQSFKTASQLSPEVMEAHYALGLTLERTGQFGLAAQALEEVLRLKPDFPEGHRFLARLYQTKLNKPEKAQWHSQRAQELEKTHQAPES